MKNYDFDKAKKLIEENKNNLREASLGMHEDWFWTAEAIWEDGEYKRELPTNVVAIEMNTQYRESGCSPIGKEAEQYTPIFIGGIYGSFHATPALNLVFKKGKDKMIPCFIEEEDGGKFGERIAKKLEVEKWHGPLSKPVQDNIQPLEDDK